MANYHAKSKMGILVSKYKKKYPKAMAEVKALNELQRKPKRRR